MANALNIKIEIGEQPKDSQAVALLLNKWPRDGKPTGVDAAYGDEVGALAAAGLITGKSESATVHLRSGAGPSKLIVIGLGEREKESPEAYRIAGGALAKVIKEHRLSSVALLSPGDPAAVVTGLLLRGFQYSDYKGTASKNDKPVPAVKLTIVAKLSAAQRGQIDRAVTIAEAQNYARGIASRPGNDINPPSLAKVAEQLARDLRLGVTILDDKKMKELGMGGILGVGAGSNATPPRMIVLEYPGPAKNGKPKAKETLLVVGKAITFDTGGISIKQAQGMQKMVFDKCGGMAVLGLMHALGRLKLNCRVVGILSSAENHISETAYRPGDILRMFNGVTVEVTNTDAEGRLVLGDALSWGIKTYEPAAVIDLATLTGGVVVALGKSMAGVMGNSEPLIAELQAAAKLTGEKIWPLPVGEDQRDLLKSDFADIVNSGPREASPLQGGAFLSYFVPESVPWAHLDIAGVADTEKEMPYYAKGATGWGVRTLVEWVSARCG